MSTSQVIIYQIDKYMVDRSNNMLQKQDIKKLVWFFFWQVDIKTW